MKMIEIINRILKKVVHKLDKNWNNRLIKTDNAINNKIINYLKTSSKSIVFDSLSETFVIIIILRVYPNFTI